jgi:hypothetical protein
VTFFVSMGAAILVTLLVPRNGRQQTAGNWQR